MSEENPNVPVEQTPKPVADETPKTKTQDTVSYETHRKLLAEKKQLQERFQESQNALAQLQGDVEAKTQRELEEQNRFKELFEMTKAENESLKTSISERDQQLADAFKLDAFNKALGDRKIDRKYSGFIDTKNILIDPESNTVDQLSAQKEVERILTEYPEIVRSSGAKPLPSGAPQGTSSVKRPTQQERLQILAKYVEAKRKG